MATVPVGMPAAATCCMASKRLAAGGASRSMRQTRAYSGESGVVMMLKATVARARWWMAWSRSRSRSSSGERLSTKTGNPRSRHTSNICRDRPNLRSAGW